MYEKNCQPQWEQCEWKSVFEFFVSLLTTMKKEWGWFYPCPKYVRRLTDRKVQGSDLELWTVNSKFRLIIKREEADPVCKGMEFQSKEGKKGAVGAIKLRAFGMDTSTECR